MQKKLFKRSMICTAIYVAIHSINAHAADEQQLDEVIVTATRSEISTADAPGSVTVISRQDIERKSSNNIVDLIRATPGISIRGIGSGGRKSINIRGMESKHTLILIDGKRVPSSNDVIGPNTDYQYDWIPSDLIERIEIVRGPMSVLYGADALGGVINIITRKPDGKLSRSFKLNGYLANGDSSNDGDGHNIDMRISGGIKKNLQVSLNAQQSRRDSVDSQLKKGQSAIEGRKKQQANLSMNWQPKEQHNIKLDITVGQDTATRRKKLYQSRYDIDRKQYSLGWKGIYGEKNASLRVYQSKVDIKNHATNGIRATAPQALKDTTLEGSYAFPVGDKQFLTTGFEHRKEELSNKRLKNGRDDISLNALYLQDEIDLTDNLLFTLGARLDDHSAFGHEASPRASLVWSANDKLTLKASYGHGFRAPNIKQASSDYVFTMGRIKVTGNDKLKAETNNAFELGANYTKGKYSFDVAVFDNKVKNLIELTGPITDRTYQNISKAHLKGVDLSGKVALTKNLDLKMNYQYLDAKDNNGETLKHRPRHSLSSGLQWNYRSLKLHLGAEYVSHQLIEHNRVTTDVPGYTVWNMGVEKRINKHFKLSANIDNLTDIRLEEKSPAFLHEEYPRTLNLEVSGDF